MRKLKALEYTCGLGAVIVGLGLYSYYVRELLASLVLFSAVFFSMGLVVPSVFLGWCASKQVALWSWSASRNTAALALAGGADSLVIGAMDRGRLRKVFQGAFSLPEVMAESALSGVSYKSRFIN